VSAVPERIVFPDQESFMVDHLQTELGLLGITVQVGTKIPTPRPMEFVHVVLTGGAGRSDARITAHANITVDCRAATESRAAFVAERVRAIMNGLSQEVIQYGATTELAGPVNFPDSTTPDQARYTQTFIVHVTGSIL
jgi:acetylornithine deacetylase/succinyl-diaminopimelate desuccinylase-like protein